MAQQILVFIGVALSMMEIVPGIFLYDRMHPISKLVAAATMLPTTRARGILYPLIPDDTPQSKHASSCHPAISSTY
jgi:hypothetical protein